jgi:sarcosine oxidase delta subunit
MRRAGLFDGIDSGVWGEAFVTDSRAVGDGESTLRYLSRYVFRIAISNARIVSLEKGRVRFRWKKSGCRRWRTMELDALEFLRRFLQHVLPPGFQKVRHYGFLSPHSSVSLDEVRQLVALAKNEMAVPETEAPSPQTGAKRDATTTLRARCPHCGGRLHVVEIVFHRIGFRDSG